MIHDEQSPYEAASDAITSATGPGNYDITSTHRVYEEMPEEKVKEIFQQVRKYARS